MSYTLTHLGQNDACPRRLRILVADDDEISRKVLSHVLLGLNHETKAVSSGLQAIKELANGSYDVLFLDLYMPDMGGLEATRFILSMWKPEDRPMIVGLTADTTHEGREKCIAAGMDGFLSKPFAVGGVRGVLDEMALLARGPQEILSMCMASIQPGVTHGN